MAEVDWTVLTDSKTTAEIAQGVTVGVTPPNGGGTFVYAFNSLAAIDGASGLYTNQANFGDGTGMLKGGYIQGAIQRGPGASTIDFAPMFFFSLQGTSVNDIGYLLGLSDADPTHIILRKGKPSEGLPETVGSNGVLVAGSIALATATFYHLRLEVVVNDTGEVILNVFQNDLDANTIGAPVWVPVPGMDTIAPATGRAFVDDALGINSGSIPLIGGRAGKAFRTTDITRRGYFDHVRIARQP